MALYFKNWIPTAYIRYVRRPYYAPVLQQQWYCYESDSEGLFGAKLQEEWRDVPVEEETEK